MGLTTHVATFSTTVFDRTLDEMRARREEVHALGRRIFAETGKLDPDVNIFGVTRVSRNAMIREGDVWRLVKGPKHNSSYDTDGTGSMGKRVAQALHAMGEMNAMLVGLDGTYHRDLSYAVVQDVDDTHGVYMKAQWETDVRAALHIRKLVPDKNGYDRVEDYDLGLAYNLLGTRTDLHGHYGLRGMYILTGDQIGRGFVTRENVKQHLGLTLQADRMSTRDICQQLMEPFHCYFVQVNSEGYGVLPEVTGWWQDKFGVSRVILVDEPEYLGEVWAGLTYITETAQPDLDGFTRFITAEGANKRLGSSAINDVWKWLQVAQPNFGAQTKLPGYDQLPKAGDVFAHLRHAWPIGHAREAENVTPTEEEASVSERLDSETSEFDWTRF